MAPLRSSSNASGLPSASAMNRAVPDVIGYPAAVRLRGRD